MICEEHWHFAKLALDPAAGKQQTKDVEIRLQAHTVCLLAVCVAL